MTHPREGGDGLSGWPVLSIQREECEFCVQMHLTLLATHNPAGLIISTGMKAYDEETGRSGIEGRVKSTVTEIADVLQKRFQQEGWIS